MKIYNLPKFLIICALYLVLVSSINNRGNWVDYVNILGGTNSKYDFSHGSTLPLISRPWAFNTYAPITDTDNNNAWWFHPNDKRIYGIRVTHQPSPWINDYGNFIIKVGMPLVKVNNPDADKFTDYSGYNPSQSIFKPYLFETSLLAYSTMECSTKMMFTSTNHGGIMRIIFPTLDKSSGNSKFTQIRRISVKLNGGNDTSMISDELIPNVWTISGKSTANHGGVSDNFAHYFVLAIYHGDLGLKSPSHPDDSYASSTGAKLDFSPEDPMNDVFIVRFATSLISLDQAIINLHAEVSGKSFLEVMNESKDEWNTLLSRVSVDGVHDDYLVDEKSNLLTTFYSSLYRASLFPRQLSEYTSSGQEVHWSPYDGLIHDGPLSTDSGFWDAFHTVYPLQYLINPAISGKMVAGWLSAYQEGGWLPKWSSPGYRSSMVGTMGDVSLADAIVKHIPGFNTTLAYEAIRKDAFIIPDPSLTGVGRDCMVSYLKYGYVDVSSGCDQLVSRSMNYWQSDYAVAQAALLLGYDDDYDILSQRAMKYDALFDTKAKLFRSRLPSLPSSSVVDFDPNFDQFAWGGEYTEAGPYQYKFYVPYDPKGLSSLYQETLNINICDELDEVQQMPAIFHIGTYGSEIHEQTEFSINCWGQYSHNNQPSHYMLYMFGAVDPAGYQGSCASKGQYYIRHALSSLYAPDVNMFAGDEDNGEMGAWYVLSSLGLYALSPGSTDYVFGSPLFSHVTITIDEDATLIIQAINNSRDNVYVSQIYWNDVLIERGVNAISYDQLMQGGNLTFHMTDKPSTI